MWAGIGIGKFPFSDLFSRTAEVPGRMIRCVRGLARRAAATRRRPRLRGGWPPLIVMAALLATGCAGAPADWKAEPPPVHFGAGEIAVVLPEGHPFHRLELRTGANALLLAEAVPAGTPHRARFEYAWRPGERLLLLGFTAKAPPASHALAVPAALPQPVEVSLQLPSGVPLPAGVRALALPAGAAGSLTLAIRNLVDAPQALRVRLRRPPFLTPSGPGGAPPFPAGGREVTLALRNETARIELPFRVAPAVGEARGRLEWVVEGAALPSPLRGQVGIRVVSAREMRGGLKLIESSFPADGTGRVLVQQPRETLTLDSAWAGWLSGRLGTARRRDPYRPIGFTRLTVRNQLAEDVVVVTRTRVVSGSQGASAPSDSARAPGQSAGVPGYRAAAPFGNPLLKAGQRDAVSLSLVPASGTAILAEPLYADEGRLTPGAYSRCTEVIPWGLADAGATTCVAMRVVRSPLAGWVVVWGGTVLAVGLLLLGLARMNRWARRFPLRDLVLVALMAGLAFLVVSVPGLAVRALTALLLGPFGFVVEGLIFKLLLFLLLGCLFSLVRRPGVFFLFYGLWMVAQALLSGHYSPMVVLFAGATITFIEGGLWLSGLTRPGGAGRPVPWLGGALLVGLAEGVSVFWGLQLIKLLFRVYLADWFVLLQAGTEAIYAALGLALGLRMGMGLAAARRPPLAGRMAAQAKPPGTAVPAAAAVILGAAPGTAPASAGKTSAAVQAKAPGTAATGRGEPLLSVENLTFSYPGAREPILRGVNLHLNAGEVVLLAGSSGAGKTTLLRLVQGLLPWPEQARLTLAGRPADSHTPAEWAASCGLLFQEAALQVVRPTVEGEVAFGAEVAGLSAENRRRGVEHALAEFGLEGLRERPTSTLSGGELQRTALAGLLAVNPRVLMLDEPMAHLDESGRAGLAARIRALADDGRAVLITGHRAGVLAEIAGRALAIEDGTLQRWEGAQRTAAPRRANRARTAVRPLAGLPARSGSASSESLAAAALNSARYPAQEARQAPPPLAVLDGVSFAFPGVEAPLFQALRAAILPGRAIALTGPNGAGKSTLLALLLGQLKPDAGSVLVAGRPAAKLSWSAKARCFGYLPQRAELVLQAQSAQEELAQSLRWRGAGSGEAEAGARAWLERLELEEAAARPPNLLSRGQRQRLALGAVMIGGPRLLVLDEPFAGQDPERVEGLLALLGGFLAEHPGRAVLVVTHDLAAVEDFFGETWRLESGRLTVAVKPPGRTAGENSARPRALAATGGTP